MVVDMDGDVVAGGVVTFTGGYGDGDDPCPCYQLASGLEDDDQPRLQSPCLKGVPSQFVDHVRMPYVLSYLLRIKQAAP